MVGKKKQEKKIKKKKCTDQEEGPRRVHNIDDRLGHQMCVCTACAWAKAGQVAPAAVGRSVVGRAAALPIFQ